MIGRGRNLSRERHIIELEVRGAAAQRLDRFVIETLVWKSRSRVQKLIRRGVVTVNSEPSKPSRRVRAGDVVRLTLSPGVGVPTDYEERQIDVVYEDRWLAVVNKPPGMLVHPVGRHVYDTLINYLHHRYHRSIEGGDGVIPRLCHRLDRDTTGLLVVGKDSYVHREVSDQFETRRVAKEYLALVAGIYPAERRAIDIPLGEGRCLRSALEAGVLRPALTAVEVQQSLPEHTLLRCSPHTGRQNQIRVHLAAVGFPIVGDIRYGGPPPPPGFPPRYLLHSARVRFHHPRLKMEMEIEAPPPDDFRELVARLAASSLADPASARR